MTCVERVRRRRRATWPRRRVAVNARRVDAAVICRYDAAPMWQRLLGWSCAWALGCASTVGDAHVDVDATTSRDAPVDAAASGDSVASIAVGVNGACAVLASGALWCWGRPALGRDGGAGRSRYAAWPVDDAGEVAEASLFQEAALLRRRDGTVAGWGNNHHEMLGAAIEPNETSAAVVLVPGVRDVVRVAAGLHHTCAIDGARRVLCWGGPYEGALGVTSPRESATPVMPAVDDAVEVSASVETVCARRSNGEVWCWGASFGRLPSRVQGVTDALQVSAGWDHTCVLRRGGVVGCWGSNQMGQLGDATTTSRNTIAPMVGGDRVVQVGTGYENTCALRDDASVWCVGSFNGRDALGAGRLVRVEGLPPAAQVSVGAWQACVLGRDRSVWCWGRVGEGEQVRPVRVTGLP